MVIEIDQHMNSPIATYDIFINKEKRYVAKQHSNVFKTDISLLSVHHSDYKIFTIRRCNGVLRRPAFAITDRHGNHAVLEMISYWRTHYRCHYDHKVYDIYAHRGLRCSIFENDKQIAWYDKQKFSWNDEDNYFMLANNNVNHELLIAFCLAYDSYHYPSKGYDRSRFTLGNIFFEKRKFDKLWKANKYEAEQ